MRGARAGSTGRWLLVAVWLAACGRERALASPTTLADAAAGRPAANPAGAAATGEGGSSGAAEQTARGRVGEAKAGGAASERLGESQQAASGRVGEANAGGAASERVGDSQQAASGRVGDSQARSGAVELGPRTRCGDCSEHLAGFAAAVQAGRFDEALDRYVHLGGGPRDDPRTLAGFAGWLILHDARAEARDRLEALASAGSATMEVQAWLGLLAGLEGRCAAASKHHARAGQALTFGWGLLIDFPRAVERDARAIALYLQALTETRCRRGDAITTLARAFVFDRSLAPAHTRMGELYQARKQWHAAEASYLRAIRSDPAHVEAQIRLGVLYSTRCRLAESLPLLESGRRIDDSDARDVPYHLCYAYAYAGRTDEALRACDAFVAANADADTAEIETVRAIARIGGLWERVVRGPRPCPRALGPAPR